MRAYRASCAKMASGRGSKLLGGGRGGHGLDCSVLDAEKGEQFHQILLCVLLAIPLGADDEGDLDGKGGVQDAIPVKLREFLQGGKVLAVVVEVLL